MDKGSVVRGGQPFFLQRGFRGGSGIFSDQRGVSSPQGGLSGLLIKWKGPIQIYENC